MYKRFWNKLREQSGELPAVAQSNSRPEMQSV
jgi:hypothetical protein